jgi:uncharacterized protein YraI
VKYTVCLLALIALLLPQKLLAESLPTFGTAEHEEVLQYMSGGTVYNTIINEDNVNVRAYPTVRSAVITKLNKGKRIKIVGVSKETQYIDGFDGHWFNISYDDYRDLGWVFSKYIDADNIFISEITVDASGNAVYRLGDEIKQFKISFNYSGNRPYFLWDFRNEHYHYSCIPGCYIFDVRTNKLTRLTYNGAASLFGCSQWNVLTDDLKYLMTDNGTAPPPRHIYVWRVDSGEMIYSGSYVDKPSAAEHSITVVYHYMSYMDGKWGSENTHISTEIRMFGRNFRENNTLEEAKKRSGWEIYDNYFGIYIECVYNPDTAEERPVRAYWKHEM